MILRQKIFNPRVMVGGLVVVAVLIVGLAMFSSSSKKAEASGGLTFSLVGTHPEANAQATTSGKALGDLMIDGGKLYAGYGDYNSNTGPIDVDPFDLTSHTFDGSQLTIPTEQTMVVRKINGSIYFPMTDPTAAWTDPVGYGTNDSGSWQNVIKIPAVHNFDMASLGGSDLWMVGSSIEADNVTWRGATAYHSTDGGANWTIVQTDQTTPYASHTTFERYYWIASLAGKIYIQAAGVTPAAPLRIFDGVSWTTGTTTQICNITNPAQEEVFAGRIVCSASGGAVSMFDGTTLTTSPNIGIGFILDYYKGDDGFLYALGTSGIARTTDLSAWQVLATTLPTGARSIAVAGDRMYLGMANAQILESDTTLTSRPPIVPEITSITPNSVGLNTTRSAVIIGKDFLPGVTVLIGGVPATVLSNSSTVISVTVPASATPGSVDVKVINPDTQNATLTNSFSYLGPPVISGSNFSVDGSNRHILTVTGTGMDNAPLDGLTASLVSLNGTALPFCTAGTTFTAAQLAGFGYNPQLFSDSPPCYFAFNIVGGTPTSLMTANSFSVWVPDSFDITAQGVVRVTSAVRGVSNNYVFNAPAAPNTGVGPWLSSPKLLILTTLIIGITSGIAILIRNRRSTSATR